MGRGSIWCGPALKGIFKQDDKDSGVHAEQPHADTRSVAVPDLPKHPRQKGATNAFNFNKLFGTKKAVASKAAPPGPSPAYKAMQQRCSVALTHREKEIHKLFDLCIGIDWDGFKSQDPALAEHVEGIRRCLLETTDRKKQYVSEWRGYLLEKIDRNPEQDELEIAQLAKEETKQGTREKFAATLGMRERLKMPRLQERAMIVDAKIRDTERKATRHFDQEMAKLHNRHVSALNDVCARYLWDSFKGGGVPPLLQDLRAHLEGHAANVMAGEPGALESSVTHSNASEKARPREKYLTIVNFLGLNTPAAAEDGKLQNVKDFLQGIKNVNEIEQGDK